MTDSRQSSIFQGRLKNRPGKSRSHGLLDRVSNGMSACVCIFVIGMAAQPHPTRDRVEFCHHIQPLELQMQVPVSKTSELEILRFPGAVLCRLDCVDERTTVRFNGSIAIQRVEHVVDGPNVLFSMMAHAEAAVPFGFDDTQDDTACRFQTRCSSCNAHGTAAETRRPP